MRIAGKIRVMLSSRCNDKFSADEPVVLTSIRRQLKSEIEAARLFGEELFEVWINEDAEAMGHTADSWEVCLQQARECDIMVVLYNGNAGWAKTGEDIGVCHAEYMEACRWAPGKVLLIELPPTEAQVGPAHRTRNERFAEYQRTASAFRGSEVRTTSDLRAKVYEALVKAVLTQTRRGAESARLIRNDLGAALEWMRLDYAGRRAAMEKELQDGLRARAKERKADKYLFVPVDGKLVMVLVHAIPAAFSIASAREPVGRPHLRDHHLVDGLNKAGGPLHVVACHRTVTEAQATALLGFPDATVVRSPFGVYVADDVQKIQYAFLANCRDPAQTRHALQRFWEWLDQAQEGALLARRAMARSRIVKAVAGEQLGNG